MSEVYEKLMKCYKSVREKTDFVPEAALILGSGLGDYADDLKIEASINYADIEGFPYNYTFFYKIITFYCIKFAISDIYAYLCRC